MKIEEFEGSTWIACTKEFPLNIKYYNVNGISVNVYHPDAKEIGFDGSYGDDTHYLCPNCLKTWWVEIDG